MSVKDTTDIKAVARDIYRVLRSRMVEVPRLGTLGGMHIPGPIYVTTCRSDDFMRLLKQLSETGNLLAFVEALDIDALEDLS